MTQSKKESDARILIDELLRQARWDPADKSQVQTEERVVIRQETDPVVSRSEAKPFTRHAPLYDLKAAAGGWSSDQTVGLEPDELGWIEVPEQVRLSRDHFVARVQGRSMEPKIPDGSYCLFRHNPTGTRQGKLVLVWHRGSTDPALGGEFSVKKYESAKIPSEEGDWKHLQIRLKPLNPDPRYKDLVFDESAEGDIRVLAEFVDLLAPAQQAPNEPSVGRADYVLLDQRGRPLAVIEAKGGGIDPYTAKAQVLPYAKSISAPFIFLTNGELIYFWDYSNDDARIVNSLFSRRDLERAVEMRATRKPLATVPIPDYYLRQGEQRKVRPYQTEAMRALDQAVELGKRRFLIELPTGTGKTDLICLYLERLFKAGRAERVLFLVDRDQLAKQALEALQDILNQHGSYWLKPGMIRQEQQITVCLLQTMIGRYQEFTSGYYDVVIADECHRSIYGAWQTALTHFDALHIA